MKLVDHLKQKLQKRGSRTSAVLLNAGVSLAMKLLGMFISLFMVPLTLSYLTQEEFGIWMTISSILYWFAFLDVGLSNGMRNYMSQAISEGNYETARRYFYTTLLLLTIIFGVAFCVTLGIVPFINLTALFNTTAVSAHMLKVTTLVAIGITLINFVVKNIAYIYVVHQQYAWMDALSFVGHLLGLIVIWILTRTTEGNLFYLVLALTSLPVLVYVLAGFHAFSKYSQLLPRRGVIDFSIGGQIVGKGLGFFAIQITSCLVIFGCTTVFISHYCGPEDAAVYNIAFRLFNLIVIVYTAFISPLWNGYTDASVKGDWEWIRKSFNRSLMVWGLTVVGGLLMLALCGTFYRIWLQGKIEMPFAVSLCTFLYVTFFNLNNCATYLINGLNVITVQIISSVVMTAIYVGAVLWVGPRYGLEAIILCVAGSYLLMSLVHLYQCRLIIHRKATGIWNR